MKRAWNRAKPKLRKEKRKNRFSKYQHDPVGFCTEVLGEQFTDDIVEVMLSVLDTPVTIAKSANSVGKTHAAARLAIWFFLCFPDSKVFTTAAPPLPNLKKLLWGEIHGIVRRHPHLFWDCKVTSLNIEKHEEWFITGLTIPMTGTDEDREEKFSGKHAPHMLFIVDEANAVPNPCFDGIESCMSGEHDRLLCMFNPRQKSGPVWIKERDRLGKIIRLTAFTHPNVVSGKDLIPGAVSRNKTVRRIHMWTRPLEPTERIDDFTFEVPKFLVGSVAIRQDGAPFPPLEGGHRKIIEPSFSYMVLGKYPAQSERQLFAEQWILDAVRRHEEYVERNGDVPPPGIQPKLGLDVAEYGSDPNVLAQRYGVYIGPFFTWNGMDTDFTALNALEYHYELNSQTTYVDKNGYGSSVAPRMVRKHRHDFPHGDRSINVIPVLFSEKPTPAITTELGLFDNIRDQLYWALREWLKNDPHAMLPKHNLLLQELRTPTYEVNEKGYIRIMNKDTMRDLLKRSPDYLEALILTFAPFERAKVVKLEA